MHLKHHLEALLREGGQGTESYTLVNPWASGHKFASFAYIAEQYGYRYDGLSAAHSAGRSHPVFAFRRLPDAERRAAATVARYPNALHGGPFPGMRPEGDGLTPLPETQPEVDLLHARIKVDLFGKSSVKRIQVLLFAVPIGIFIALAVNGNINPASLLIAGCVTLVFFLYLWLAATIMRRRHARYSRMLERAGIHWPPRR